MPSRSTKEAVNCPVLPYHSSPAKSLSLPSKASGSKANHMEMISGRWSAPDSSRVRTVFRELPRLLSRRGMASAIVVRMLMLLVIVSVTVSAATLDEARVRVSASWDTLADEETAT